MKQQFQKKALTAAIPAALALSLGAMSTSTMAQEGRLVLEEVLVTATKTEEVASEVAISANVLTSEALSNVGAQDFTDIAKIAPGLDFASSKDPVSGAIKLRGVGSDSFEGGNDKAVAVFVDGYAQSIPNAVFSSLTDVERVEVLRGPQGTLYGKNAPAGVIKFNTKAPDFDGVGGYVKGSVSNYNTYRTEGALNIPLIDGKLAMRISGFNNESDGYYDNVIRGDDGGASHYKGGRLKLLFVPTDDLVALFAYHNTKVEAMPIANLYDGPVPNSAAVNGGTNIESDPEDFKTYGALNRFTDTEIEDATLSIDWELGGLTLTSLTGYSEFAAGISGGNDGVPTGDTDLENFSLTRQITEEIRLANNDPEDLEWLVGVFYSHLTRSGFTDLLSASGARLFSSAEKVGETWGYFGNAIYYINDKWKVSAGLRYNDEKKALLSDSLFGRLFGLPPDKFSDNYYQASGSLKLHYFLTDEVMLYAAVDSAYRSGDFNDFVAAFGSAGFSAGVPASAFGPSAEGAGVQSGQEYVDTFSAFGAEESTSFEIGMKGTFMDGRARLYITLFDQIFEDYQIRGEAENGPGAMATFVPGVTLTVDEVNTRGMEMEGEYLFTENLSGSFSTSYAHATVNDFANNHCAVGEAPSGQVFCPKDGDRLTDDPLWNANVQLAYESSLGDSGLDYSARLIANYKTAPTYDNGRDEPTLDHERWNDDLFTVDLNVTFMPADGQWAVSVWGKNLTDEARPTAEPLLDTGDMPVLEMGSMIPPLTYGVTGTYNF